MHRVGIRYRFLRAVRRVSLELWWDFVGSEDLGRDVEDVEGLDVCEKGFDGFEDEEELGNLRVDIFFCSCLVG